MPVFVLPWEILLLDSGFEQGEEEDWFYQTDGRRVQIKVISSLVLEFHATHEICFVAPSGIVWPFRRSYADKVTTVYGPKQGYWQIEELRLLRDCGWTIFYQSTLLPDEGSGDTMLCAESISSKHALFSEDTKATIVSEDENESAKTMIEDYLRDANMTASDDGILVNLLGQSVQAGLSPWTLELGGS
ncbi:hypothetical protein N7448_011393 [Penicillium atrosanguineum]|nr:hypothetical protein N7448_011393 [Penicillium atrosanguineum]